MLIAVVSSFNRCLHRINKFMTVAVVVTGKTQFHDIPILFFSLIFQHVKKRIHFVENFLFFNSVGFWSRFRGNQHNFESFFLKKKTVEKTAIKHAP